LRGPQRLDQVIAAYEKQMAAIELAGGRIILMASPALAQTARSDEDYAKVYDRLLTQAQGKVIIQWAGDALDPALAGYWGHRDLERAGEVLLAIVGAHKERVDGIMLSLLDKTREAALRRRLPPEVRLYTGDEIDFMLGGQQSARSLLHLAELFRLADGAGLLADLERAARRMTAVLRLHGIGG
jgi:hypothetical protein